MASNCEENNLLMRVIEALHSANGDAMKPLLEAVLNTVMKTERDKTLNAEPYERSEESDQKIELDMPMASKTKS